MSKRGLPGGCILSILIKWIYEAMDLSDYPHVDMVSLGSHDNFWNWKSEFPQGNFQLCLTQHEISRKRPFKPMDIEYD